jgi:hypothetical protein
MQKAGMWEEAFAALEEFANLCPDQDDVRLMLAEQLTRKHKHSEALEQLQILYGKYRAEDRTTEANATLERMRALDPDVVPQETRHATPEKGSDLIFLQVSYDEPEALGKDAGARPMAPSRDPRLSGAVPITPPGYDHAPSVSPGESGDFILSGEEFGRQTPTDINSPSLLMSDSGAPDSALLHDPPLSRWPPVPC